MLRGRPPLQLRFLPTMVMRWAEGALRAVLGDGTLGPPTTPTGPLVEPVERFIAEIGEVLVGLAGTIASPVASKPADLERDVALEALSIAAAIVDADGRHGGDELTALLVAFGDRFGAGTTTGLTGRRGWLERPSTLFEILVGHDARDGTRTAWRYYELAMRIAHTVASLDAVPSPTELAAIDGLRTTLLGAMKAGSAQAPAPAGPTGEAAAPAPPADLPPARSLAELLAELDALVGLAGVKAEVRRVADLLRVMQLRAERGLPTMEGSRHLVFTGNPGTGKTTVARLVAQIYRTLGVVDRGHLVETDRSGLVAGFVGQTAPKVKAVVESAMGGLLLIDEAYSLIRGGENDFGKEAIDTLVKLMEDHRDDLVVIAAGYPDEMTAFVDANPGLKSRFPRTIHFPDYTTDELVSIFTSIAKKSSYVLSAAALEAVRARLEAEPRDKGFGNGRLVRNMFEAAVAHQASRIVALPEPPTDEVLCALEASDIESIGDPA
jgi:hypothetical protein